MQSRDFLRKPSHPRAGANCCSRITFWWMVGIFKKYFKREIQLADLYEPLYEHTSNKLGDLMERYWDQEVERAERKKGKPSLGKVIFRCFGRKIMLYGFILFVMEIFIRSTQPKFLARIINLFGVPDSQKVTKEQAFMYATGVVLCSALNIFITYPTMLANFHLGMKIRVGCCSLIYRKALRLSLSSLGETTAGQIVNLMSNDVNRFDNCLVFMPYMWIGPIGTAIATYLMWEEVGIAAVYGTAALLLFVPIEGILGKRISILRMRTAIRTDERVRLMNEIVSGIQVIKMYAWEEPFAEVVDKSRKHEINAIRCSSYIRGTLLSLILINVRICIFASVVAYVLHGNNLTADKVFILVAFYNILRQEMTNYFPQAVTQIAEAMVSVKRIQKFLLYDECNKAMNVKSNKRDLNETPEQIRMRTQGVKLINASAKWSILQHENSLNKVSLEIRPGSLVGVIGPVGAGKTSLLHVILKELPLSEGRLEFDGTVSYASQEPWLFAASVRQNILFGQPFHLERYKQVVKVCALKRDFQLLPYMDRTLVGERGVSLSGGQRARVNLARAVYKDCDVYVFDDPLSAVDPQVSKQLFDDCIVGFLKGKTVILATHQLHHLKHVEKIFMLSKNGSIIASGTYNELHATGLGFSNLLEDIPEDSTDTYPDPTENTDLKELSISSMSSLDEQYQFQSIPKLVAEMHTVGSVGSKVYAGYFRAGGNCCVIFWMVLMFLLAQVLASGCDYWVTYWTNTEQDRLVNQQKDMMNNRTRTTGTKTSHPSHDVYGLFTTDFCIYMYTALIITMVVVTWVRAVIFFIICMRASINLHDSMFRSISHATMYFFNTNPSGRILNRFSKDMGAVDELLPSCMIDCLQIGLILIGVIVVVCIVNYWLIIPTVLLGILFFLLRMVYLHTSRSVKRLEGITRSPVFQHLNASLQGLTTIRSFKAQYVLRREFDTHQDLHSAAWYLFIASSVAFGFWVDICILIYIAFVTYSFLLAPPADDSGGVGLAITQVIGLTGLIQWGMRQSTELENQMTSVERVLEFTSVDQEPPRESVADKKPPDIWPTEGGIMFEHLYLKYAIGAPPVLKDLNLEIKAKEKVGIVGRTGAGKSSLIQALFRLAVLEGSIYIDGVNTLKIGLHDLRRKLSIIPQEPVLFSGTLRMNLDPFNEYSDSILWQALQEVELKAVVMELEGELSAHVTEGGGNFSVGQRQLLCLARAIVRNNKILVLDEATANVDPQTDTLIQITIRETFANCTVLTIAHRLNTVMDSDKVLVMDAGRMVEFDHPHLLLQRRNGYLYNMVQQTGKGTSNLLRRKAKASYEAKQKAAASKEAR